MYTKCVCIHIRAFEYELVQDMFFFQKRCLDLHRCQVKYRWMRGPVIEPCFFHPHKMWLDSMQHATRNSKVHIIYSYAYVHFLFILVCLYIEIDLYIYIYTHLYAYMCLCACVFDLRHEVTHTHTHVFIYAHISIDTKGGSVWWQVGCAPSFVQISPQGCVEKCGMTSYEICRKQSDRSCRNMT